MSIWNFIYPQAKTYTKPFLYIYSLPNLWWTLSNRKLQRGFRAMVKNGFNATFCEFNPGANWLGKYTFPDDKKALSLANNFHKIASRFGIKVIWSYNWNNKTIADKSDVWLFEFMDQLPSDAGFEVGEWNGSRNTDPPNDAQAKRVCEHAEAIFPQLNIWNEGCRPKEGPPDNEYVCVHLADIKQNMPKRGWRYIACTDHSILLDQLGQGGRDFQKWDLKYLDLWLNPLEDNSIHEYHFMGEDFDLDAIELTGKKIQSFRHE
jgi:hypothetical protein